MALRKWDRRKCCMYSVEGRFIQGLLGKPKGKKPREKHRRRWTHNTKIHPKIRMAGLRVDCCEDVGDSRI
jgi:hypothetical protein